MLKLNLNSYDFFCVGKGYRFDLDMVAKRDECSGQQEALTRLIRPEGKKILDAGCGLGRFSKALAAAGAEVIGVDIVESLVLEARRRAQSVHFVRSDLASLPFDTGKFDAVASMYSSFGYSRGSALRELQEIRRVCRLGGILILDVENSVRSRRSFGVDVLPEWYGVYFRWRWFGMQHQLNAAIGRLGFEVHKTSVTRFSKDNLEMYLESAGWHVLEAYGDYSLKKFGRDSPRILLKCQAV